MALSSADRKAFLEGPVARFIADRLAPIADEIDEKGEFPLALYREIAELGALGLCCPEEYGGFDDGAVTMVLLLQAIAAESVSFAVSIANCSDCAAPILAKGSEAQKREYVPQIISGEIVPAFCLSEPSGGSDVAAIRTKAVRDGDEYVITGRKMWITSATVADLFVVFAKTDFTAGHRGISAFLVPRNTPGLEVGKAEELLGTRASPTAEVSFSGVRVPASALLGQEGEGFKLAMSTLDESRIQIAAVALGAANKSIEIAVNYARERIQFGKPIIEHQGLGFLLSELLIELACAQEVVAKSVELLESGDLEKCSVYAAIAKVKCSDLSMRAAIDAAQVLGGYGLTKSYPIERLIRDSKALQIFEGTNEIQKWLIARDLQKRGLNLASPISND